MTLGFLLLFYGTFCMGLVLCGLVARSAGGHASKEASFASIISQRASRSTGGRDSPIFAFSRKRKNKFAIRYSIK